MDEGKTSGGCHALRFAIANLPVAGQLQMSTGSRRLWLAVSVTSPANNASFDTRGRLIAETDPGGTLKREYLYLNDIPLAVFQ